MTFADYIAIFTLGLLGSGHCVGMCGVFSVAVSASAKSPGVVMLRQLCYQLGKSTAYMFIGVVLLFAVSMIGARESVEQVQSILAWVVGIAMIVVGLAYALEVRWPVAIARWWQGSAACGALSTLWSSPSLFKSVLVGWVNGFLPCGLSLLALLTLVRYGSVTGVVAGAYVFGLGTMPALLALGILGQRLGMKTRRWLVRATGVALIIFGVVTLMRGNPQWSHWMHGHGQQHAHDSMEVCQ